jgi:N-acetyl-anhydromuramyl-L-alanine amidase AmpD
MLTRNYTPADRNKDNIWLIILHCTDSETDAQGIHDYFQNTDRQVSCHFIIGRDGKIVTAVKAKNIAWTNGSWDINKRSISIELVGKCAGFQLTKRQADSLVSLMADLSHTYELSLRKVFTYEEGRTRLAYGVAQHANVVGSDHWDIGPQFPIRELSAHAQSIRNDRYGVNKREPR